MAELSGEGCSRTALEVASSNFGYRSIVCVGWGPGPVAKAQRTKLIFGFFWEIWYDVNKG